jgi:hypothetical protein
LGQFCHRFFLVGSSLVYIVDSGSIYFIDLTTSYKANTNTVQESFSGSSEPLPSANPDSCHKVALKCLVKCEAAQKARPGLIQAYLNEGKLELFCKEKIDYTIFFEDEQCTRDYMDCIFNNKPRSSSFSEKKK